MRNFKKNILTYMFVLGLIGLIIGSFYDLQINKLLFSRGSLYPNFFKFVGEIPMIIIISVASLIFITQGNKDYNKILIILISFLFIAFPIGSSITTLKYFGITNIFLSLIIALLYYAVVYFIVKNIKIENQKKVLDYSLFVIISIVTIFITFNVMKSIWGRMRFYAMLDINNFSNFTNWWVITSNEVTDDIFKSFPSGHTSAGATTLVLIFIPEIFREKISTNLAKFFRIFPIAWTILVMYSRIFDGAHFLSDVSMALVLTCVIIFLFKRIYLSKYFEN